MTRRAWPGLRAGRLRGVVAGFLRMGGPWSRRASHRHTSWPALENKMLPGHGRPGPAAAAAAAAAPPGRAGDRDRDCRTDARAVSAQWRPGPACRSKGALALLNGLALQQHPGPGPGLPLLSADLKVSPSPTVRVGRAIMMPALQPAVRHASGPGHKTSGPSALAGMTPQNFA